LYMIEKVFSQEVIQAIKAEGDQVLQNIDKNLMELIIAGIYCLEKKHIIWVVGENENIREKAARLKQWFPLFTDKKENLHIHTYLTPFEDPYINNEVDIQSVKSKIKLVANLLKGEKAIIMTTISALNIKIERGESLREFLFELPLQLKVNRNELLDKLTHRMGYKATNIVEEPGDVAWRGSILDVFPIDRDEPVRIEIEAGSVISIRVFDPDTQKSMKQIERAFIPVSRFFLNYDTVPEYFSNASSSEMKCLTGLLSEFKVVTSDRKKLTGEYDKLLENYRKLYEVASEKDEGLKNVHEIFGCSLEGLKVLDIPETFDTINLRQELVRYPRNIAEFTVDDIEDIGEKVLEQQGHLYIYSKDEGVIKNLKEYFGDFDCFNFNIPYSFVNTVTSSMFFSHRGFQFTDKIEGYTELKPERLIQEIQLDDYVVHRHHGVGQFVGFKKLFLEGNVFEFLKIEYQKKEFLYVPVYEANMLSKYISFEGVIPHMDKMGGVSWKQKRRRAKSSIIIFAKDLLELYATRKAIKGNSFVKDPELEDKLEQDFQYVETMDQKKAIRDVERDLEAEYPMDRLICGDVSFGKTEVALRAAFRVVSNGKQVVILCPTTILASQHFGNFQKRFADFPITIGLLSRMVKQKERKKIYENLEKGSIDIIIGTHSLIARDIKFKRLGLYVIDEEQRFGVFQKERLKKNREEIDVLSLSATPIPRTLSLSLAGLQDISTIKTAPIGRMAIKNYIGYFSREILISAVLNEVERGGQIFIVYNNINKIFSFMETLQEWLPEISMKVIHAQMKNEQIEKNITGFINNEYSVLISTTIIENGIDIPAVNTLIVMDADKFGLTQLYQLRGRIGRGNKQAYAYFLVKTMSISDKAKSRLNAIREFADLGSGFKLAEFDLKLRGAGSLLGNRQHGHIEALGFDYYHKLLKDTIKEIKSKGEVEGERELKIKINFPYSINRNYIENAVERVSFYQKILDAKDFSQINELRFELEDRYGKLDESVDKIFFVGIVRVLAYMYQFEEVEVYLNKIEFTLLADQKTDLLLEDKYLSRFDIKITNERILVINFKNILNFCEFFYEI
jgi:transcription-repair coupling factor (superfamily II helicase)